MRRIALAAVTAALVSGFAVSPAGAAQDPPPCDPGPCPVPALIEKVEGMTDATVEDVIWAVRCAGYALGGNPCY